MKILNEQDTVEEIKEVLIQFKNLNPVLPKDGSNLKLCFLLVLQQPMRS